MKQLSLRKSEIVRYRDKENVYNPEYDVFHEKTILLIERLRNTFDISYMSQTKMTDRMTDSEVYEQ